MNTLIHELSKNPNDKILTDILAFMKKTPVEEYLVSIPQLLQKILSLNHVSPINLDIFYLCIDIFFSQSTKDNQLYEFPLDIIFNHNNIFYYHVNEENLIAAFYKKNYSQFSNVKYSIGDYIDFLYKDKEGNYGWTEGEITICDGLANSYGIKLFITSDRQFEPFDSFKIKPHRTFTKERYDWQSDLVPGDIVDVLDNNSYWYKTTIEEVRSYSIMLGERICEMISNKPMNNRNKFDNCILNSMRIRPRDTFSFDINYPSLTSVFEQNNTLFNPDSMHIPFNDQHYIIPKLSTQVFRQYSLDYYDIGNYFMKKLNESINSLFGNIFNENESLDHFKTLVSIMTHLYPFLHQSFSRTFIPYFITKAQKYLLNLSKTNAYDYSIQSINSLIYELKNIAKMGYYTFEIDAHFYNLELDFAMNCINDDQGIDKKLKGLNLLKIILSHHDNCLFMNAKKEIFQRSAMKINWTNMIQSLLTNPKCNNDLIEKTLNIFEQSLNANLIDDNNLCMFFSFIIGLNKSTDKEIKHNVYDAILKQQTTIGFDKIRNVILNQLILIDVNMIQKEEINLMTQLVQSMSSFIIKDSLYEKILIYFFELINNKGSINLIPFFGDILTKYHISDMKDKVQMFVQRLMNSLTIVNLQDQLFFLNTIIKYVPRRYEDEIFPIISSIVFPKTNSKLTNAFFGFIKENNFSERLLFTISSIVELLKNHDFLSNDLIKELFNLFAKSSKMKYDEIPFLRWLSKLHEKKIIALKSYSCLFDLLPKTITAKSLETISREQITFFWELFLTINDLNNSTLIANSKNPLDMKHAPQLWNVLINYKDNDINIERFIELYALPWINQTERQKIWDQFIKVIFANITKDNQTNSIYALSLLIDISEFYQTSKCKSHGSSGEDKEITLKIIKNIIIPNEKEFNVTIAKNKTLYDLRAIISDRIDIDMLCFDICLSSHENSDLSRKLNGSTIESLINNERNTLYLTKSKIGDIAIPYKKLTEDAWSYNPEAHVVFSDIFDRFSTNGTMTKEDCARLITQVLNTDEEITVDSPNVELTFNFDNRNHREFTLQLFLEYYLETIRESNEDVIWTYLKNLGYRNDLRKLTDPLAKQPNHNNNPKAMPRSILSQNQQYFKAIFDMCSNETNTISAKAKELIDKIETNELIYEEIITKLSSEYINKEKNETCKLSYILQIMNLIFEKNNQNQSEIHCLKDFFIQKDSSKSSCECFIELFIEQMTNLFNTTQQYKNHSNMINLYVLLLQLIQKILIHLIHDDALNGLLMNYIQGCEGEITKINTNNITTAIRSVNYLHLDQTIKIIGKNITLLTNENSTNSNDTINKAITLSFQIMLIGLLVYDNEKEFNGYLGFNFKDFLLNQLNMQCPYLQGISFLTLRILFSQYQNDENFFKNIERMIVKTLRNMMLSNDMKKYDPSIIVKVYQDTIKLINYTKDEQMQIISEFIDIAEQIKQCEECVIIGFFTILRSLIESALESSVAIEKLIDILLNKFLMSDKSEGIMFTSDLYLTTLFGLLKAIILQSNSNLVALYSNSKISSLFSYITIINPEKRSYNPTNELKGRIDYIGIKNLGAICYMNSVLQQLYFIKPFSYGINEIQKPSETDNILYQLQRMYSYLELTNRSNYSPEDFVYSYKDLTGKPTDITDQCDAQEFLSRFLEMIENQLKNTHLKYLLWNVFGGESCSQLKCLNKKCKTISNRFEHLYFISLDIKTSSSLEESLRKYITEETVDDYVCEKCKSTGMSKQVSFNSLPNVLFIHLQRISFNKIFEQNEKINSKLTFSKQLNLKDYCTEELHNTFNKEDQEFSSHVYPRDHDYYKYKLVGTVIHSGTGQYGHYYSLIDVSDREDSNEKWMKFNDGSVTEYSVHNLEEDAFGGETMKKGEWTVETNQSAYMLVYERIQKTSLTLVGDQNILVKEGELLELNDKMQLNKMIDVNMYQEAKNKSIKKQKSKYIMMKETKGKGKDEEKSNDLMVLDDSNEKKTMTEYLEVIPYQLYCDQTSTLNHDQKHQRIFTDEVLFDNLKLVNDKKIYSAPFSELIEVTIKEINKGTCLPNETIIDIFYKLHNILLSVLSKAHIKQNIKLIIDEMIIVMSSNQTVIEYLINDLHQHFDNWLTTYIFINDSTLGEAFSKYIGNIITLAIENNTQAANAYELIDHLFSYFPTKILTKHDRFIHFFEIIDYLTKSSENKIKEYLIGKRTIYHLCQVFLGTNSPYYKDNGTNRDNVLTGKFTPLISTIAALLTYDYFHPPSVEERASLVCPLFCQKAIETNTDMASLCKIIGYFKILDKTYIIECLRIILRIIDDSNDYDGIIQSFILVTNLLETSDESTTICIENLIGIQRLGYKNDSPCLKFMAPLMNGYETVLGKMFNWAQQKQFVSFVELFYELLKINLQVLNYVKLLPTTTGDNIEYGLLKEIRGAYLIVVEQKNLRKDDDYIAKIENIETLFKEINFEFSFESNVLGKDDHNKALAMKRMKIYKEVVCKPQHYTSILLKKLCPFVFLKGFYDITTISEEEDKKNRMMKMNNQYDDDNIDTTIRINNYDRYYEKSIEIMNGVSFVTEDIMNNFKGKSYSLVRYFLLNQSNINITVKFNFNDDSISHFPKTQSKFLIPMKSICEILTIPKENDKTQNITIEELKPEIIQCKPKKTIILNEIKEEYENDYTKVTTSEQYKPASPPRPIEQPFQDVPFQNMQIEEAMASVSFPVECGVCGANNMITETQVEFKCSQCQSLLFQ